MFEHHGKKTKLVGNSLSIWKSSDLDNKKALLKNIFPEGIPINEKRQVGTPTFSLLYQSFSVGGSDFSNLVEYVIWNLNTLSG